MLTAFGKHLLIIQSKSRGYSRARTVLLVCIVCCSIVCCKRLSDDPLAGWKALTEEPTGGAIYLQQAEESQCVWKVGQDAVTHRITIQPTTHVAHQREVRLQTEAGMLVGTDNGEWGGSLSLTDAKGTFVKRLLDTNVIQLLPSKSGVLVFTGLLHMGVDEGAVWLYSKSSDGNWSIRKLADLDGSPSVISSANGDALTVGDHGVYRLDQALSLTEVSLPFIQTHPNSITEDTHGRIYIGMNAFVVRLVPAKTGYRHEWFTKPECLR
jgi:ligand-binding sensor domain-containing protein